MTKRVVVACILLILAFLLWYLDRMSFSNGQLLDRWDKIASICLFILAVITLFVPLPGSINAEHVDKISTPQKNSTVTQIGETNINADTARDIYVGNPNIPKQGKSRKV